MTPANVGVACIAGQTVLFVCFFKMKLAAAIITLHHVTSLILITMRPQFREDIMHSYVWKLKKNEKKDEKGALKGKVLSKLQFVQIQQQLAIQKEINTFPHE